MLRLVTKGFCEENLYNYGKGVDNLFQVAHDIKSPVAALEILFLGLIRLRKLLKKLWIEF